MKAELKRLTLTDWRSRNLAVDFTERTILRGTNGTGKSTVFDALLWLLTGYDSADNKNYDLFDSKLEFTAENAIPAVVEGVFDVDGQEYVFRRSAKSKWERKKGSTEYTKATSDEYLYYTDGLAVSAKTYTERIENLFAPIEKLKLMLNVRQYLSLEWKVLRKHFADMVGIIDESELKDDYSSIRELIEKHKGVDNAKEWLRQQINPLKVSRDRKDSEIKGKESMLPDVSGVDAAELRLSEIKSEIEDIDRQISGLGDANKPLVDKRNAELQFIADMEREIVLREKEWDRKQNEPVEYLRSQLKDIDRQNLDIAKENGRIDSLKNSLQSQLEMARQQYQFYSEERDRLAKEKDANKAAVFDENQVCTNCGQPLPADRISQMRDDFYARRETTHKSIIEKGVRARDNRDAQQRLMDDIEKQLSELPEKSMPLDSTELENGIENAKSAIVPFRNTDEYRKLITGLAALKENLTVIPPIDSAELSERKKALYDEMADCQKTISLREQRVKSESEIKSDKDALAETVAELAHLEGLFNKCIQREREWASIVRDRANRYLTHAHIEMTELSKSGDCIDICTVTIDGVDAKGTLNNAHKVIAGIDIANAFQKNAGLNLPIFIDDAERIADYNLPDIDNQLILAYVDKDCPELVIE